MVCSYPWTLLSPYLTVLDLHRVHWDLITPGRRHLRLLWGLANPFWYESWCRIVETWNTLSKFWKPEQSWGGMLRSYYINSGSVEVAVWGSWVNKGLGVMGGCTWDGPIFLIICVKLESGYLSIPTSPRQSDFGIQCGDFTIIPYFFLEMFFDITNLFVFVKD
jgi:hypothetical protein